MLREQAHKVARVHGDEEHRSAVRWHPTDRVQREGSLQQLFGLLDDSRVLCVEGYSKSRGAGSLRDASVAQVQPEELG
jgi:hypothetical protein